MIRGERTRREAFGGDRGIRGGCGLRCRDRVVHDHTSVLKLVETKWNLPALTYRDANASNLLDSLDLDDAPPNFLDPTSLAAAPGRRYLCRRLAGPDPAGSGPEVIVFAGRDSGIEPTRCARGDR